MVEVILDLQLQVVVVETDYTEEKDKVLCQAVVERVRRNRVGTYRKRGKPRGRPLGPNSIWAQTNRIPRGPDGTLLSAETCDAS